MKLRWTLLASLVFVFVLSADVPAKAQVPSFQPPRPTLSPYFELYRRDTGPLGGYGSYRNRQRVDRELQQQAYRQQQQASSIRALDQRMSMVEGPSDEVRATGTGSVFMNYSHYYNMRGSGGQR